jgi:C1A family cysteine protease
MNEYYAVIGGFVAVCAAAAIYTFLNPKVSFAQMPVIDETSILVHNGQNHRFTQAPNTFFEDWTISDTKKLFEQGLSDTQNVLPCKSMQDEEVIIPESYDWREDHPSCVRPVPTAGRNCSSSYVLTALSAVEDRICSQGGGKLVKLSSQEIIDCDMGNHGCSGGFTTRVFNWGKRKGFVPEECYPATNEQGECPDEYMTESSCRIDNNFYRVMDYCMAYEVTGIKKEILKNGPVIGQITPFTDMLTYKEGVYQRTQEAFKFPGNHLVKVVGWETMPDESSVWIIENTWGEDWGDNGYAKINSGGETTLDFYAIGTAIYPFSMAEYYAQQQAQAQTQFSTMTDDLSEQLTDAMNEEIENGGFDFDFDMDDEVLEELDPELFGSDL